MEVIYIKYKERFLQKDYKILKEKRDFDSEKFLSFLEEKEYFEKPASINHHLNVDQGLLIHSYNVYKELYYLNKELELNIPYDTLIIEGLFHDLDKCFSYTKNRQKTLTTGKENYLKSLYEKNLSLATKYNIDEELKYSNDDASVLIDWFQKGNDVKPDLSVWNYNNEKDLPIGHAELSIIKLQEFFKLKEREILSIRYHMSVFEPGLLDNRSKMNLLNRATELYPDIKALQLADQKATFKEDWQEKKQ
jgi:hypothetical protein